MPENPTTEGPEKSLRQRAPGGDIVAVVFGLIAAYLLLSVAVSRPDNPVSLLLAAFFIIGFGLPAYLLWAGARGTGVFVTDDRVEYRALGRVREGWPRSEIKAIEPLGGGLRLVGNDDRVLREYRFRWWSTELVSRFAHAAGLSPVSAAMAAAARPSPGPGPAPEAGASAEVNPGKPGEG